MRDKCVPLTARYLLNFIVSILGLEEEAKVLVCTRKQQGVLRVGTNRNGVKLFVLDPVFTMQVLWDWQGRLLQISPMLSLWSH